MAFPHWLPGKPGPGLEILLLPVKVPRDQAGFYQTASSRGRRFPCGGRILRLLDSGPPVWVPERQWVISRLGLELCVFLVDASTPPRLSGRPQTRKDLRAGLRKTVTQHLESMWSTRVHAHAHAGALIPIQNRWRACRNGCSRVCVLVQQDASNSPRPVVLCPVSAGADDGGVAMLLPWRGKPA